MNWLLNISPDEVLVFKGLTWGSALLAIAGIVALVALLWLLQTGKPRRRLKGLTLFLRFAAGVLIVLALMEPTVRRKDVLPQQSFLAHAYDVSGSMSIEDQADKSRLAAVLTTAGPGAADRQELDDQYRHVDFVFDDALHAQSNARAVEGSENATDLLGAFRGVQLQTKGFPMAGVILLSDGNPTLNEDRKKILEAAREIQAPVYTVGCAPRDPGADFWIDQVSCPAEAARNVDSAVRVLVGVRGRQGHTARVELREGERVVETRTVRAEREMQALPVDFVIRPMTEGVHYYNVRVSSDAHESYPWNNEEDFFVNVVSQKRQILYIEGYPRYEYRFLRAAFEGDERFQVKSVVYVTQAKHTYRQGVERRDELVEGFPEDENELFGYDAVVIGDIAAARFTTRQLEMLHEFVRSRGGALLFLGGKDTFAASGFGDSPLAGVLPFRFAASYESIDRALPVVPTRLGIERSMFGPYNPQLDSTSPWAILPPLKGLYPLHDLKPGAQALCAIDMGEGDANPAVVAYQRYGRGTSLICGISATWPWKFRTPSDNVSYEAFWKEMILVLMQGGNRKLTVDAWPRKVTVGDEVKIRGSVANAQFQLDPTARVDLRMETPTSGTISLEPRASSEEGYTFEKVLTPSVPGVYKILVRTVETDEQGKPCESEAVFIVRRVAPELREVRLNESLLREIAAVTGGDYVHLSDYGQLKDLIEPRAGTLFRMKERPLWDKGLVLASILGLLLIEWLTRRLGGLA
ncbi:hypothetical protein JW916_06945 [Candidatus Sumerlaeota bacterium]|nr:hypothetical protein [Candidatus Sumerlaeota bacterium]